MPITAAIAVTVTALKLGNALLRRRAPRPPRPDDAAARQSASRSRITAPPSDLPLLPPDPALPGLGQLFDPAYFEGVYRSLHPDVEDAPEQIELRRMTYRPGQRILVTYAAQRVIGDWVLEDEFAIELLSGEERTHAFRYPEDPYLPGLATAASAVDGEALLRQNVRLRTDKLRVELVRYRPSTRAVLRYRAGLRRGRERRLSLYVRAMRPALVSRFVAAGELADRSSFHIPSLAGRWDDGGIVWLTAMPGRTVRHHLFRGTPPEPALILDSLASLWALDAPDGAPVTSLPKTLRFTERFLAQVLQGRPGMATLAEILAALAPLADTWQPSGVAHNDFYDDQLILLPSGELGLVDFEECGLGDQMVDVANMLAHLRWSGHFLKSDAARLYREQFRAASLARFGWDARDLDLREAYCLLRLCTNPVRGLRSDWRDVTEDALLLARSALPAQGIGEQAA